MARGLLAMLAALLLLAPTAGAQTITEYQLPDGSSPQRIAAGPDGALWFAESGRGRIGRITVDGVLREHILPGARPDPVGIAAGRDALFYTQRTSSKVGRIELDGRTREFDTQNCVAAVCGLRWPDDITVAPDGSPWFSVDVLFASGARSEDTYQDVCSLGPMLEPGPCTQVDQVNEPTGHASGGPTVGPDGAMWITNKNERIIGRIPSSGPRELRRYQLTRERDPEDIVAGPDGALWFTEPELSQIGRITVGGAVSTFALPARGRSPLGIAPGPDGAMWFTESSNTGNAIGRITRDGTITEFPLRTPESRPNDIVAGPDGAMWFTQTRTNRIGRISVPAAAGAPSSDAPATPPPASPPASPPPPAPASPPDTAAPPANQVASASAPSPALTAVRVRPRRVTLGRRSASFAVRFRLARRATVSVRLQRSTASRRTVTRAARQLSAGQRTVRLRLPRRGVRPGAHQVVLEARERGRVTMRISVPVRLLAAR